MTVSSLRSVVRPSRSVTFRPAASQHSSQAEADGQLSTLTPLSAIKDCLKKSDTVTQEPAVQSTVERWPALFTERQVFAEFNCVTSKNLEGDFYEALDQHTPRFIELFKSKKGTTGQKLTDLMQHINCLSPDVTALRSVVLRGLPIVLSDDSSEVYKTCFDTAKEEALASVTVGVLTVVNEDAQQQGLNAVHLQPISTAIILEGSTVMDNVRDFPQAVCLMFGLM